MAMPEMLGWLGSAIAFCALLQQVLPRHYTDYIVDKILNFASPYMYFEVFEIEGHRANELYESVRLYLSSLSSDRARRSRLSMLKNAKEVTFSLSKGQYVSDFYKEVALRWEHKMYERRSPVWAIGVGQSDETRLFELKLLRKDKDKMLGAYIAYINQRAKEIDRNNREVRLYSNKKGKDDYPSSKSRCWDHIPFRHPATFDSIAMDPELKLSILEDLQDFVNGKEFYSGVGKAWKRGYLLYGPPGTGKTSIVAAMANKLQYDIYDLELTEVKSNAQLRQLLVYTESRSIIVIEDIDCSLDLSGQRKKGSKKEKLDDKVPPGKPKPEDDAPSQVTLSGLLNFTDGLWSSCEDERIFIFTTNFVNKLDPALLRSGRMDMHINLSYCTFDAFKTLATNFLHIKDHALYPQVEELLNEGTQIVPSEVGEVLMRNRKKVDIAMEEVVEALRERKRNPPPPEQETEGEA